MNKSYRYPNFAGLLRRRANAVAIIDGSGEYREIKGQMRFFATPYGVLVTAEVMGLPVGSGSCDSPIFAFHIHDGSSCSGNSSDPFANAGMHYNPRGCLHPYHAGDLPPLMGAGGYAFSAFLANRFTVDEIIGKTVIIHSSPDDFMTQPAGNAGKKIACGEIVRVR